MDKVVAATAHFKYRCGTCQSELHLGALACISKGNFVFCNVEESSVNEQPYGLFCAIFPSKMKVTCAKCRAKLGYSGRGLCGLDKSKFCYRINCKALYVVVNSTEAKDASMKISEETENMEAGHEITAFLPLSKKGLRLKCMERGHNSKEQHALGWRLGLWASNCPQN